MSASLDPRKAHLTRQHGDILAVYTWINDKRAMVLIPARRAKAPWYIVEDSAAYKYDDPRYLAQASANAAKVMGMDENSSTAYRIASIIHEGLPDLIRMPPAPKAEPGRVIGEAVIRREGREIKREEVREKDVGATYG